MPAQEPDLAGSRRRRRRGGQIDLERGRAGRDVEEVVLLLSASDRAGDRVRVVVPRVERIRGDNRVHRLELDARAGRIVEVQDRRVQPRRRRVDVDHERRRDALRQGDRRRRAERAVVADPVEVERARVAAAVGARDRVGARVRRTDGHALTVVDPRADARRVQEAAQDGVDRNGRGEVDRLGLRLEDVPGRRHVQDAVALRGGREPRRIDEAGGREHRLAELVRLRA